MELSSHVLKKLLISKERTYKAPKSKKNYFFFSHFLFVERELFKHRRKKKPRFLYFPYKEGNFSKSKYFLIIIIKHFFLIFIIFFSIHNQFIFSIFWELFVTFTTILSLFFFFFFRKIFISFMRFSCSLSSFSS